MPTFGDNLPIIEGPYVLKRKRRYLRYVVLFFAVMVVVQLVKEHHDTERSAPITQSDCSSSSACSTSR
jgi:hypothetical protein